MIHATSITSSFWLPPSPSQGRRHIWKIPCLSDCWLTLSFYGTFIDGWALILHLVESSKNDSSLQKVVEKFDAKKLRQREQLRISSRKSWRKIHREAAGRVSNLRQIQQGNFLHRRNKSFTYVPQEGTFMSQFINWRQLKSSSKRASMYRKLPTNYPHRRRRTFPEGTILHRGNDAAH